MATSEPPPKNFMTAEVIVDFSDSSTIHDRVLVVEGKKFHVHSNLLSQFSEFFYGLFNGHFKEKNEEEIELKAIRASDFNNFLSILYPIKFMITSDNILGLMELSGQFLCPTVWILCLEFLEKKEQIKKISHIDLLQLYEKFDALEVKILVESHLMDRNKCMRYQTFENLDDYFQLSVEYGLDKFKTKIEHALLCDLHTNTFSNLFLQGLKDILLERMAFLKEQLEIDLNVVVEKIYRSHENSFMESLFTKGGDKEIKSNMEKLLIELFAAKENKKTVLENCLTIARDYGLLSLEVCDQTQHKEIMGRSRTRQLLVEMLKPCSLQEGNSVLIDFVEDMVKHASTLKECIFYLETTEDYSLDHIKSKAACAVEQMFINEECLKESLPIYLEVMRKHKFSNLTTLVEEHLVKSSEEVEDHQLYNLLLLVEEFDFTKLKICLDTRMSTQSLEDPYDLYYALKTIELTTLPNLVVAVDKFIDEKCIEFDKTKQFVSFEPIDEGWADELKELSVEFIIKNYSKSKNISLDLYHQMASMYNLPALMMKQYYPVATKQLVVVEKFRDKQKKLRKQKNRAGKSHKNGNST